MTSQTNNQLAALLCDHARFIEAIIKESKIGKRVADDLRLAAQRLEARGEISEAMVQAAAKFFPIASRERIEDALRAALEASQKGETP